MADSKSRPSACAAPVKRDGAWWIAPFVLGAWATLTAAGFWFVAHYGRNCPWADEWALVPWLCGRGQVTAEWIFHQHNEHRIPLPRLVLFGLYRACKLNLATGAYLNAAVLSLASLLFIWAARRARGGLRWTDVIFPALLLSWIHWENMISGWQLQYTLPIVLAGVYLVLLAKAEPISIGGALAAALVLAAIGGCGANGILLAGVLGLSLAALAWRQRSFYAGVGVVALAAIFVVLRPAPSRGDAAPTRTLAGVTKNGLALLGSAFGPQYCPVFIPYMSQPFRSPFVVPETFGDGAVVPVWPIFAAIGFLVCAGSAIACLQRRGSLPVSCFWLAGVVALAVLTWTRQISWTGFTALQGPMALTTRYALLLSPIVLGAYLLWEKDDRGRRIGQPMLAAAALAAAIVAIPAARWSALARTAEIDAFLADVRAEPAEVVAERHSGAMFRSRYEEPLAEGIRLLRSCGHPSFRALPADNR